MDAKLKASIKNKKTAIVDNKRSSHIFGILRAIMVSAFAIRS